VGYSTGSSGTRAVIWNRDSGAQGLAGFAGSKLSQALAINDSGIVVGISKLAAGRTRAVRWTRGIIEDLGTLPGDLDSEALAINNAGQVAGFSSGRSGTRAVLWNRSSAVNLGTLPGGEFSQALGINAAGIVVGISGIGSRPDRKSHEEHESHAFVWTPAGGMRDLNDLIPPGTDIFLIAAVAINEAGQIAAYGGQRSTFQHDGPLTAYLLTPAK
jgi:probable HAF family extracellular repeat protein